MENDKQIQEKLIKEKDRADIELKKMLLNKEIDLINVDINEIQDEIDELENDISKLKSKRDLLINDRKNLMNRGLIVGKLKNPLKYFTN